MNLIVYDRTKSRSHAAVFLAIFCAVSISWRIPYSHGDSARSSLLVHSFQPPSVVATSRGRRFSIEKKNHILSRKVDPRQHRNTAIFSSSSPSSEDDISGILARTALFGGIGLAYWYLLVLGAAADANGLPVPSFIPMVPGWPVDPDTDLKLVLEDSVHFFYISDLLNTPDNPYVPPPRLSVFNFVEAWIFAMLPLLWKDSRRRLPRPVLLVSWLALGINLTNAFLAPYLAVTELKGLSENNEKNKINDTADAAAASTSNYKNPIVCILFAAVASAVVFHAATESLLVATPSDWEGFWELARTDRSYLAFCVDPILFSIFQPLMLARVKPIGRDLDPVDYIPFVGLISWLVRNEDGVGEEV